MVTIGECAAALAKMVRMTFAHLAPDPAPSGLPWSDLPSLLPTLAELKAMNAADVGQSILDSELTKFALAIFGTVVAAVVVRWLLHRAIDRVVASALTRAERHNSQTPRRASRVLAQATGLDEARKTQRAATMGAILKSTSTFVIVAMALLTILEARGVPLGPLLASAGVGGVALGFGAQSLVKDFLSGIFMILEDQYGVGDVIDTGEAIGTVEDVTLRVTRLRDANGIVWYIRNGEIVRVGNRSQGWSTALVDIPVAYSENLDVVLPLIRTVMHELDEAEEWSSRLLEEPVVAGVESMAGGVVTVRIFAKCAPNENFSVSREIRERVKAAFDLADIRSPHVVPPYGGGPVPPFGGGAGQA
jgi:moderate conductance mechanosensitive channel